MLQTLLNNMDVWNIQNDKENYENDSRTITYQKIDLEAISVYIYIYPVNCPKTQVCVLLNEAWCYIPQSLRTI